MTDPIADMIIRIKNSVMAGRKNLLVPHSKMKEAVAKILQDFNYIEAYELVDAGGFKQIKITLKYIGKTSVINGVKRVSKPGCRIYRSASAIS
jgi:small subunit ribosomal protein S8